MITQAEVRAALNGVIHPSFGMSLVALGMIRSVRVSLDAIEVDLVLNCPGCPAAEAALSLAHKTLTELSNGSSVRLNLLPQIWEPPWRTDFGASH